MDHLSPFILDKEGSNGNLAVFIFFSSSSVKDLFDMQSLASHDCYPQ